MRSRATVISLVKFELKLRKIKKHVQKAAAQAVDDSADDIMAMQRRLVPEDEGDLKASIRKEAPKGGRRGLKARRGLAVAIKAGGRPTTKPVRKGIKIFYDYALAVEFGRKGMSPRPFFYPAYRANRKRVRARISRAINTAIKRGKR